MTREAEIAHAREIDTEVARLYALYYASARMVDEQERNIKNAQEYIESGYDYRGNYARKVERLTADLPSLQVAARRALGAAIDFDAENYDGWSRFFLVQHIHSSMYCSSFRPTTRIGWLPDVSGLTEAEAVAAHGESLCTKCFPDAPVALTVKPADPNACKGTGVYIPRADTAGGRGYYADCPECGKQVSRVQGSGKLRKHKA